VSRLADSSVMPLGIRFADVLNDALTAIAWDSPGSGQPGVRTAAPRPVAHTPLYHLHKPADTATVARRVVNPYAADTADRRVATAGGDVTSGQAGSIWSNPGRGDWPEPSHAANRPAAHTAPCLKEPESHGATPSVSTVRPARRRRRLTTTQSRALDAFNRLGAGVRVDFSLGELRSAFRMLARRYHPDRHPDASVVDRHRLAWQFTTIRNSYQTLLTAFDSPGL